MPTLLSSGFGPFPGYPENASRDALAAVEPKLPTGWSFRRLTLDVAWGRAAENLINAIDDDTRVVVAFGQADDDPIRIERFALNAPDRSLEDIDGERFTAQHIAPDGPTAYETDLPIERILDRLTEPTVTAVESHYAGSYLCNFTFYRIMHLVARSRPDLTAGFVHVPPASRLDLAATTRAMCTSLEEVVDHAAGSVDLE